MNIPAKMKSDLQTVLRKLDDARAILEQINDDIAIEDRPEYADTVDLLREEITDFLEYIYIMDGEIAHWAQDLTPQTLFFNTGRLYAANGQPVSAALDPATGRVAFVDHARMIEGVLKTTVGALSQSNVMAAYDAGRYDMPLPSDAALVAAARGAAQ